VVVVAAVSLERGNGARLATLRPGARS